MTDSEKLDLLLEKVNAMEARMGTMETELKTVREDVKGIKLVLENEIRVNIQRVAEGHLDLSRNLHEAMKPSNEVEMLAIKVRMLETDVKELKAKLA